MGPLKSWSLFRTRLHQPLPSESSYTASLRLSTTPPEYWTRHDIMLSRRLRHERLVAMEKCLKRGHSTVDAARFKYASGPFWPNTLARPDYVARGRYEVERGLQALAETFGWERVGRDEETGELLVLDDEEGWVPVGYYW
ncbi:hypothetical protein AJ80_02249 [Polytolypa hystricis UAMH7299]|uniref:Uncharacterized protein n=1 Tax=Polytolypa hystricis (strain UAMH7299) TaxID=1447883 RepID=A0A2B7YRL9_POLH7|nr:hypothetical protein AJ80_02249 [Polytolypa hystricis UAMH7299]